LRIIARGFIQPGKRAQRPISGCFCPFSPPLEPSAGRPDRQLNRNSHGPASRLRSRVESPKKLAPKRNYPDRAKCVEI
jgi:hypothetical protein